MKAWDPKFRLMTADDLLRQQESEGLVLSSAARALALPRAAVTEVSGPIGGGKTEQVAEWLAPITAANPIGRIAWLEEFITLYPCALENYGIPLERVYFVEAGEALLGCVQQVVRSGLFDAVVVTRPDRAEWDERVWRRFQLVAEQSRAAVIVIGEQPTREGAWTLSLQVEVQRQPQGSRVTQVLRDRTERSKEWRIPNTG